MASAWTLVEDVVLGSAAASITFNTGLTGYTKFRLTLYVIKDGSSDMTRLRINGDTGANYALQRLEGNSTTVSGARQTGATVVNMARANIAANGTDLATIEISKPLTTTPARGTWNLANLSSAGIEFSSGTFEWGNTSDLISSITIPSLSGNLAAGTRAVLEGAA